MGTLSRTVIGFVGIALLVACGGDEPPAAKKPRGQEDLGDGRVHEGL